MPYQLCNFRHIRPPHEVDQERILDWIAEAHGRAEKDEGLRHAVREKINRLGIGRQRIEKRGLLMKDLFEEDWTQMEIYPVEHQPHGSGFTKRSEFYDREVSQIFHNFYPEHAFLPTHLIHVTCTGYVAPSPAQKLVSSRGAGISTTITHAYHMGCYASIPAIRMGMGYLALEGSPVDIVHTEVSSLHMHPLKHQSEQLLVQSLFGDGFIKYTLADESTSPGLKVLALHEETIPNSTHCMTWACGDSGLNMTLSKEVPVLIARNIKGYLMRLCEKAGLDVEQVIKEGFFAIHPGGPKILDHIKELLGLESEQIAHSAQVLRDFGNMSSATLPHIWERMLNDPHVPRGARVIGLAFGPGLSASGGLFEKR